ncbi:MAG: creatininase family protein [Tannerella sp.]|nr:creatininase family protein [Tannerella sp.]
MKRRDFIIKGIAAGATVSAGHSLPASPAYLDYTGESTTAGTAAAPLQEELPVFWEDLTAPDFTKAVNQAQGVCIIPVGVYEKHGPHLPLGTDVIRAREMCRRAANMEYCIVYPDFYLGQIFEAKHQPGTIAYSTELMLKMLDETCREIARNGLKKIILVNTHGGNNSLLPYFLQIQLERASDYAVFLMQFKESEEIQEKIKSLRSSTTGGHADEVETGEMLAIRQEAVRMEQATTESGKNLNRLNLPHLNTGIAWYSKYPNHYAGQSEGATAQLGEVRLSARSRQLADSVKSLKADHTTLQLQNEFFKQSQSPLTTGKWD